MKKLKSLINSEKKGLIHQNSKRSDNVTPTPKSSTTTDQQRLLELAKLYDNSSKRPRGHQETHDAKYRRTVSPGTAARILQAHNQPLKLYGETLVDACERARRLEKFAQDDRRKRLEELSSTWQEVPMIPRDILPPEDLVTAFVLTALRVWRARLELQHFDDRVVSERAYNFLASTENDLNPLIRRLSTKTLEDEILEKLCNIVSECIKQEYVKAHNAYLGLSIGNAAWPMGVTMVGIHERVARSKIAASGIAHILNDETTRKYIQMIKRLLTLCQTLYPTDPSRMVLVSTEPTIPGIVGENTLNN